jgi:energy-coupling factor transporter ATP-binding protein EcfA2
MTNDQIIKALDEQEGSLFIIMIGPPGCGKSTLSKHIPGAVISFEVEMDSRFNCTKEQYLQYELANASIRKENIIIDRICTTKKTRKQQLRRMPIGYVPIAINLHNVEIPVLIERMSKRPELHRRIPEIALKKIFKEFEPPSKEEGFSLILTRTGT